MTGPICAQCSHAMRLVKITDSRTDYFAGAHFDCTNCEQRAHVRQDGSGTMTIATIHGPAKTARDYHEYADSWMAEKMMFLGMRCAAHYITREEYDTMAREIESKAAEYKVEHPLPQPLWARIFGRRAN